MLDITRITLREIRLPLKEPFVISSGVTTERRILLVEAVSADGIAAWGECVAGERPNYAPETIETARLAITAWLAPKLLRHPVENAAGVYQVLDEGVRGHYMAKAALEMTAWALEAERAGIPLAAILGGTREAIPIGISLGIAPSPEAIATKAAAMRAAGYRRIKLKIKPGADIDFVRATREALGSDVPLSVDANAAYTLADAEHLAELDAFGLLMIEQPLAPDDLRRHAELQRRLETALCLDESIVGPAQVEDMLALGSGRIVNIKPGRVGGFARALAIHDLCRAHEIPVWCGGMLESGIGRAHNVALASLPGFTLPGDVSPSARYWERDVVTPEWTMDARGMMRVPRERPGLGVAVDRDRIDDLTVRLEEVRA